MRMERKNQSAQGPEGLSHEKWSGGRWGKEGILGRVATEKPKEKMCSGEEVLPRAEAPSVDLSEFTKCKKRTWVF